MPSSPHQAPHESQGKVERRWEICVNCSQVVEIDDEGACACHLRGEAPERVEVLPVEDHEFVIDKVEAYENALGLLRKARASKEGE